MNISDVRGALLGSITEEVEFGSAGPKYWCSLPLQYPSGDSVVVYFDERPEGIEVSDYGSASEIALQRRMKVGRFNRAATAIAAGYGVHFLQGAVIAHTAFADLHDVIWRVGLASAGIADAPAFESTERVPRESDFVEQVDLALSSKRVPVERERQIEGQSGHSYAATFFIPSSHTVLEPLTPASGWNRASAIYVEFGDVSRHNGFATVALVDDREDQPSDVVLSLLLQVGTVVRWSRRDPWLARLNTRLG